MKTDNCPIPCSPCPNSFGLAVLNVPGHPLANLSSEAPDHDLFTSRRFQDLGRPPLGRTWFSIGCLGFCMSNLSQDDADHCAQLMADICTGFQWPEGGVGEELIPDYQPREIFYSTTQIGKYVCPDGSIYEFTVLPRSAFGLSQEVADATALWFAYAMAERHHVCAPAMPQQLFCANKDYSVDFLLNTAVAGFACEVQFGSLPPGATLSQPDPTHQPNLWRISGNTPTPGDYGFNLRWYAPGGGSSCSKFYVISILGLTNGNVLPDATVGDPYTHTFQVDGHGANPVLFVMDPDEIPDGMTLDPHTGVFSGTPTAESDGILLLTIGTLGVQCEIEVAFKAVDANVCGGVAHRLDDLVWTKNSILLPGGAVGIVGDPIKLVADGADAEIQWCWGSPLCVGDDILYNSTFSTTAKASLCNPSGEDKTVRLTLNASWDVTSEWSIHDGDIQILIGSGITALYTSAWTSKHFSGSWSGTTDIVVSAGTTGILSGIITLFVQNASGSGNTSASASLTIHAEIL